MPPYRTNNNIQLQVHFELAFTDESSSATDVISSSIAEQLLGATADTIFQTTFIKVSGLIYSASYFVVHKYSPTAHNIDWAELLLAELYIIL